ncbi:MAG: DUF2062 domain-containing protein, partial [Zoogloeaceae bacterium]|nr:DUF2062 domain-containing protein [Zoogloeaceae bacterium]
LLHPRLWHLNRHSAAGAVAVGLFCGLVPGPLQMPSAALACIVLRVNLPLALVTTLYTNPLTIVPLYLLGYEIGGLALGGAAPVFITPPDWNTMSLFEWFSAMGRWMLELGQPLAVGLVILGSVLALIGYAAVRTAWRVWLLRSWRQRGEARAARNQDLS